MRRAALLLLLLAAALGAPRGARAQDGPDADDRIGQEVERLLRQVASDDFAVREAARKRLQALAGPGRAALERHRQDPDPEVRRTVEALLADTAAPGETDAPQGRLGALGVVSFHADGPLEAVLARWDAEHGGRVRVPPAFAQVPVKAEVEARPYFEGLAKVLEAARLDLPEGFDEAGQAQGVEHDPSVPAVPSACAGPFRLEVESVTTTRMLKPGGRTRYVLGLKAYWSPDVQVVSYGQPTVVRAADAQGRTYRGTDGANVTYGIGGGRRGTTLNVTIEPSAPDAGSPLAALELSTRFRIRHDRDGAVFDDLPTLTLPATRTTPPGTDKSREAKVTLESFGPDPERARWSMGVLTAVLPRGVPPEGLTASLETTDGTVRAMYDFGSRTAASDGVVRLTVRAPGAAGDAAPKTLRVAWYAKEEEVPVTFVLEGVPLK